MPENQLANEEEIAGLTPAERLKEFQTQLKQEEDKLAKLTKERDALKADVDTLAKSVGEIEKAKAGFAKGLPQLGEERDKLQKYKSDMVAAAEALLGPRKDRVVAKIEEVEKKITDQKAKVAEARKLVNTTSEKAAAAQADLDKKQSDYDDQKNLEKEIGDNLKQLTDLKTKIDKLNDTPKAASMFVLLREMNTILEKTKVPTKEEYEAELIKRWEALEKAKETSRAAKLAFDSAKIQLAADESTLAALEKSRVDDLIAATDEFNK
jgi:chromosome segregation ATPase